MFANKAWNIVENLVTLQSKTKEEKTWTETIADSSAESAKE